MDKVKNVGWIECGNSTIADFSKNLHHEYGYRLAKVMALKHTTNNHIHEYFPQAERVHNITDIFHDDSIELVIVTRPTNDDLDLVAAAISAGKQVRVL